MHSQDKGYISLSYRVNVPTGDFGSSDITNAGAGFAEVGSGGNLCFAYLLGKNYGISALTRGTTNPLNASTILELFSVYGVTSVSYSDWTSGAYMVGGYGSFPLSTTINFEVKPMIGILSINSPHTIYEGENGLWIEQVSASASSFAFLLDAGLRFNVSKRICLLADMDYFYSSPDFTTSTYYQSNSVSPSYSTTKFTQHVGGFDFMGGVGWRFY